MSIRISGESAGPIVLAISGMTCGGCAGAVGRALSGVSGVVEAQVDLAGGRVTVTGTARAEDLLRAVEAAGFTGELA
ncbi:MAG: heavy-metal-associated domain-containing protein [Gammaproteobacteria bacterium]|nr:heavy-metal-associated domain-containing protein [Gammaproteobacteria bacterium]MDE2263788.1 heavy-metal-associated domain-containing protein [Gammaproteobacteria bacterium]